jgi:hypothetical protein
MIKCFPYYVEYDASDEKNENNTLRGMEGKAIVYFKVVLYKEQRTVPKYSVMVIERGSG